jgi:hypothetical protein
VLHLRTIRVEQWSPEALTSAGRKGLPGDAEPVGAVEVGEHQDMEKLGAGGGTEGARYFEPTWLCR